MAESVEQFLARGGKVTTVNAGERTMSERKLWLRNNAPDSRACGYYTDARMREAENMGTMDIQAYRQEVRG